MVRAGTIVIAVIASFARVPAPGEHIIVAMNAAQRAQIGAAFGYGRSKDLVPAIVRHTVLRANDRRRTNLPNAALTAFMENHVADVFAEAITTAEWTSTVTRWSSGDDQP